MHFCVRIFVCRAVAEIDEIWKIDRWGLAAAYIRDKTVNFGPVGPLGRQNTEGCEKL